ncbi:hypothetical protein ACFX2J_027142 [Malus domestica]
MSFLYPARFSLKQTKMKSGGFNKNHRGMLWLHRAVDGRTEVLQLQLHHQALEALPPRLPFHGTPLVRRQPAKVAPASNRGLSVSMFANGLNPSYDLSAFKFDPIKESIVSREMTRHYMTDVITYADTGVVVVDAGFARLSYTYEINKNPDVQVAITEQSVSPSGGAWLGGQLVSAMDPDPKPHMTSRQPTRKSGQPTRT